MSARSLHSRLHGGARFGAQAVVALGLSFLVAACDTPTTTPVAAPQLSTSGASKEVLVGFNSTPGATELAVIEAHGGQVQHQYRNFPIVAATVPADQIEALEADANVAYVSESQDMQPLGSKQVMDYGVRKVQAPAAWSAGYRGQAIKVGIFDSGIDIDHPDLVVAGGIDLVGDGNGLDDCQGHGTHVAGIVGARNNGNHTVGVAPAAALYSMRFADCAWAGATTVKMLKGLDWAIDNGMDVVNMSFGYTIPVPDEASRVAFQTTYERGVLLVAASGNSSTPVVGYPAAYESVIAVGATDDADNLASFSQFGTEQELTAPGVSNLASYLVGKGQSTSLFVDTDNARELEAVPLAFAGMTSKQGLSRQAIYVGFGTPADYEAVDCTGKIAVASRGGTSFAEKTTAAMNDGCAGIIIHNHTPGNFNGTLGTATAADGRAWIPAVSISLEEGLYLKDQIQTRTTQTTIFNVAGNLAIFSGTSMASPHAAGVAALVLSKNPSLTPAQVRQILRDSSDDLGAGGWDAVYGFGRVNAKRAVDLTP